MHEARLDWRISFVLLALVMVSAVVWSFETVPFGNAGHQPVDVILVLGVPAEADGSLTPWQRWRVEEGVREYRAGAAPRLLFSGGAAANRFVEAHVMADYARQLGVADQAILEEGTSRTTIENISDSEKIFKANGWRRVEVVSSAEHLHRAAVLLHWSSLIWRTHPAPMPGENGLHRARACIEEAIGTTLLRWFGQRAEPFIHAVAKVQHRVYALKRR